MADLSGTELSEEKEAEIELKKRQKRPWEDLHMSGKIGLTPGLPETLGVYDISAVRREQQQRELSAGNVNRWSPVLQLATFVLLQLTNVFNVLLLILCHCLLHLHRVYREQ